MSLIVASYPVDTATRSFNESLSADTSKIFPPEVLNRPCLFLLSLKLTTMWAFLKTLSCALVSIKNTVPGCLQSGSLVLGSLVWDNFQLESLKVGCLLYCLS